MKKTLSIIIVLSLFLVACGNSKNSDTAGKPTKKELSQNEKITRAAFEAMDTAKCGEISIISAKEDCIENIIFTKALKNSDASVCNEIADKKKQENCKSLATPLEK